MQCLRNRAEHRGAGNSVVAVAVVIVALFALQDGVVLLCRLPKDGLRDHKSVCREIATLQAAKDAAYEPLKILLAPDKDGRPTTFPLDEVWNVAWRHLVSG